MAASSGERSCIVYALIELEEKLADSGTPLLSPNERSGGGSSGIATAINPQKSFYHHLQGIVPDLALTESRQSLTFSL
jgi:hypothetical protein